MHSVGKLLFYWDYDTQWGADRSLSGPKSWGHLEFQNTDRLLEIHAAYDIKACFAVVGAAALSGAWPYHDPGQIRRIHGAGHEVASHSFRHEWLPGLSPDALRETLARSKESLEQCIGAPVVSFVPPFNQPFDYPRRRAFSLSERRQVKGERTDLEQLCETLFECGYSFSRVAYRTLVEKVADGLRGRRVVRPASPETIAGLTCIRLNTAAGFADATRETVLECVAKRAWAIVYGHPHSLFAEGAQNLAHLAPFMEFIGKLRNEGRLSVYLPREIVSWGCLQETNEGTGERLS